MKTNGRTLLVITTANQVEYTKWAVESIRNCALQNVDLLVVDDCSIDGTVQYCNEQKIPVYTKTKPLGLTNSWNVGYKYFKENNYQNLILANNDILVPQGAIENLLECLEKDILVGVMSSLKGVTFDPIQALKSNHTISIDDENPDNYQKIQDHLNNLKSESKTKIEKTINGFFFGLNRSVSKYELPDGNLFDPLNINVGNESELCERIKEEKVFCLLSFVFHYKGISFGDHKIDKNYDYGRNLTWADAKMLKKSILKQYWYRFKKKIL
ncbi:MAG: glycosyltransferase family 2 protein [Bacteroidetes bacterium]|nr:glycosyltransferase family 2 protein [Bacteroidota bacterium]